MLLPAFQRALYDPRIASGAVVAFTRDQAHPVVLTDDDQAVICISCQPLIGLFALCKETIKSRLCSLS